MCTRRRDRALWLIARLVWASIVPVPAFAADPWHAAFGVATDEVWRGVTQTQGRAAAQAGLSVSATGGWYAGAWTSIALERSRSPLAAAEIELDLFAGYRRPLGDAWMLDVGIVRYAYPDDPRPLDYDYTELVMTLDFAGRVSATVAVSPDVSLYTTRGAAVDRTAVAWELGLAQPLARGLSLTGGVGYYDLSDLFGTGYMYWNAGAAWEAGRLGIDVVHIRTDGRGRELFETRADPRTVLSVIVAF